MAILALTGPAWAENYPASGKWTYENTSASGPAKDCGKRFMEFRGERRSDTGGGVPEFRNKSVTKDGASSYRVVDEFATGQIHSRTNYTFRQLDPDHVELRMTTGGKTIKLRRCE